MSKPEITVAAVTETDGRFLVVEERINRRLVINQPAGHVERGETLLEAVVREVREETAWLFSASELVGVYLWRIRAQGARQSASRSPALSRDHRDGQQLDRGIVATHWLTRAELEGREPQLRSPWCCAASKTIWPAGVSRSPRQQLSTSARPTGSPRSGRAP